MAEFPTYEEMVKNVAEKALDEILYDGKSIREWMKIIIEHESRHYISIEAVNKVIDEWIESGEYSFSNSTYYLRKRLEKAESEDA